MPLIERRKVEGLRRKREERKSRTATRYQLRRKDKTPKEYTEHIEVYVDGKKVQLSESSLYLIDMMIKG